MEHLYAIVEGKVIAEEGGPEVIFVQLPTGESHTFHGLSDRQECAVQRHFASAATLRWRDALC